MYISLYLSPLCVFFLCVFLSVYFPLRMYAPSMYKFLPHMYFSICISLYINVFFSYVSLCFYVSSMYISSPYICHPVGWYLHIYVYLYVYPLYLYSSSVYIFLLYFSLYIFSPYISSFVLRYETFHYIIYCIFYNTSSLREKYIGRYA